MAHHQFDVHPLVLRQVHVLTARNLTPRMRRVTLGGPQLCAFERDGLRLPAFTSPMFDDHVKLIFAADGNLAAVLPTQLEHGIDWPASSTRQGRDYTPSRFDPVSGELDLDFVLHGQGPANTWARTAVPGDELWFAGPKSSLILPDGADWALLAGDETALPAIGRFLAERPLGNIPVRAVVTLAHSDAQQDLPLRQSDELHWFIANPLDGDALLTAVQQLNRPVGTPYIWAAAESRALLPLRRYVAAEFTAPKSHVNITGYWHREAEAPVGNTPTAAAVEPPPSPVAWFAVRTALQLGLLDALAAGPLDPTSAADRCGTTLDALMTLLAVLDQSDIIRTGDDGLLQLGEAGDLILGDEHLRERYAGTHADQMIALAELAPAMSGGPSAWQRQHGYSLRTAAEESSERYADLAEQAQILRFVVSALPGLGLWRPGLRVACGGPGAPMIADLLRSTTGADTTVVEAPGPLQALLAHSQTPHRVAEAWDTQDIALTALACGHRTDTEVVDHLRELHTAAPTAILVEALRLDSLSHDAADDALLHLGSVGVPPRALPEVTQLAAEAGWQLTAHHELGWGVECLVLTAA